MSKFEHIPKEQRKNILLLADDLRLPSGVGTMSREIVVNTCHRYNWIQIAAGVNHPEAGRQLDASQSLVDETGVKDAYLRIYPYNGYGDMNIVRLLMDLEKIDALMIFTDPRYWIWLFHLEHEIRQRVPIFYYSIWDDLPFPKYNKNYYRSVDALFAISKQTHNIHRNVLGEENIELIPNAPVKNWVVGVDLAKESSNDFAGEVIIDMEVTV